MKVIWKRPDGFHDASPDDYFVLSVGDRSRIWLHKNDSENYPFRVSGGWADEDLSIRLNFLVNLLAKTDGKAWHSELEKQFHDSDFPEFQGYLRSLLEWLQEVQDSLKGDTWEVEIMADVVAQIRERTAAVAERDKSS